MKRNNLFRILLLCLAIHFSAVVSGQPGDNRSVLSVGNIAPPLKAGYWISERTVSSLAKDHVYVVDFGATWCTACVAAMPHLNQLASKFRNDATFITCFVMEADNGKMKNGEPVYVSRVRQFTEKRRSQLEHLLLAVDRDNFLKENWLEAADKTGIPYTFVIDRSGKIAWIGSNVSGLDSIITAVIQPGYSAKHSAAEIAVSPKLFSIESMSPDVLEGSVISKFHSGKPVVEGHRFVDSFAWAKPDSPYTRHRSKVMEQGESITRLYYMAFGDTLWNSPLARNYATNLFPDTIARPSTKRSYGKFWYKPLIETTNTSPFQYDYKSESNRFDYFLVLPEPQASALRLQKRMRSDLNEYFGYDVSIEQRLMPCWNLVATDKMRNHLLTKTPGMKYRSEKDSSGNYVHRNALVQDLIAQLEFRYGCSSIDRLVEHPDRQPPFFDRTGISGEIDIVFDGKMADKIQDERNMRDTFADYVDVIRKMGFDLVKSQKLMKVMIIRDPKPSR